YEMELFVSWARRLCIRDSVPPALERQVAAVFLRHGDSLLQQIKAARVCETGAAAPVLEKLVEPLRKASGWPETIRVRVIDDSRANAATLPGGEIVLFRGMLRFARNGDELAGILAHEIGHVERRHAVRKLFVTSMNFFGFDQLLGNFSGQLVVHPVGNLVLAKREGRYAEREADRSAIEILNEAGFNVRPLADILERVGYLQGEEEVAEGWLATHPLSRARARRIRDAAPEESRPPVLTAAEFGRLRAVCAASVPEPPPAGDETSSGTAPPEEAGAPRADEPAESELVPGPSESAEAEDSGEREAPDLDDWDTDG
ncbi:MAG: M48 family metallopeptidase, partial [Alphaproteobacteria bacterium]